MRRCRVLSRLYTDRIVQAFAALEKKIPDFIKPFFDFQSFLTVFRIFLQVIKVIKPHDKKNSEMVLKWSLVRLQWRSLILCSYTISPVANMCSPIILILELRLSSACIHIVHYLFSLPANTVEAFLSTPQAGVSQKVICR